MTLTQADCRSLQYTLIGVLSVILLSGCSKHASPTVAAQQKAEAANQQAAEQSPSIDAQRDREVTLDAPSPIAKPTGTVRPESESDYYPDPSRPSPTLAAEMEAPYPDLGPSEWGYFKGKYLDQDTLDKAMRKRDFDSLVLDLQNGGDANALARQQAYLAEFQKSLQPYGGLARLGRVGCGAVLCMGSLRTSSTDWLNKWSIDLHAMPLPLPTMSLNTIPVGTEYEVRFAFTTKGHGGFSAKGR